MELVIFVSPNGSGKSTLIYNYRKNPKHQGLKYVYPDAIFLQLYPNPPTDEEENKKCYITTNFVTTNSFK
jgi:predicted ABC-type ATPase